MKRFIILLILFGAMASLLAQGNGVQTIREFRRGVWAIFPWVNPDSAEQEYIREINLNHMNAWFLNTNPAIYPQKYNEFYNNPDLSHIRWLEREWMDYFNSTHFTGENVGMYIGYNGFDVNTTQYKSQIEFYANTTDTASTWSNFINVLNNYFDTNGQNGYNFTNQVAMKSKRF